MVTGRSNTKGLWLFSRNADLGILFLPVWLMWIVLVVFSDQLQTMELPIWAWAIFILGIDVSHVWSSLFRSYGDKSEFKAHPKLFILAPILVFVLSILLLNFSILWFWRIMAYLAIFHFIKQQYGFTALYQFKTGKRATRWLSDKFVIYLATLYPVVFWHFRSDADFNWFVHNDFLPVNAYFNIDTWPLLVLGLNLIYWGILAIWAFQEWKAFRKGEGSLGKTLWVLTTAVNWWLGIVYYNSDVIFSVSNVVAHGIPYLALIYFYRVRKTSLREKQKMSFIRRFRWALLLLFTVGIIAMVEEYFWDMLIYREHGSFFEVIYPYQLEQLSTTWPIILVMALLAMPQQVHYVIDGFIWKFNKKNPFVKSMFVEDES